jgi:hypothetical protein
VAAHVGDARWLAPTVLRVQAFLELPFTLFAYLAVARMLGRDLHLRLVRAPLLLLASASFSITFSLVELALPNPYTHDDLVLRALSAIVTPVWVALASRAEGPCEREARPSGALGLLAFLGGAGAIAYVVLACYDALLLYNLGHLPSYAGGLAVAIAIAAGASFAAPRIDRMLARPRSRAMESVAAALATFTTLFFVPSLALRYWGGHPSAVLAGCALVGASGISGIASSRRVHLAIGAVLAAALAVIAAAFAIAGSGHVMPELVLARGSVAFLAVGIVAFRLFEVCWPAHEAKAEADQA